MAKRKTTPKATEDKKPTTEVQNEDTSKLATLVEVEEKIEEEQVKDDKDSTGIVYIDEAGFLPENDEDDEEVKSTKADADSSKTPSKSSAKKTQNTTDNKVDGVVVDPKDATTQPDNGKNEIDTMGDVHLDETNVKSRAESLGEQLQDGEENRRVAIPGKVALKEVPPQIDMDTATDLEKTEAEAEAISTMVNDKLPNKPAPEQIHEEVKADETITRASNVDVDAYKATQNLPIESAMNSTQTNHLDELPVPAGEYAMSEREMQVRRIQESNMPIMRQNSTESNISRNRPINVFQKLAEASSTDGTTNRVRASAEDMETTISEKLGVDVRDPKTNEFLRGLIGTLNDYVKRMSPRSPIPSDQMLEQQKGLTRSLAACFEQEPSVGVVGLQIFEEYFRAYSNGAFGGTYPFRSFNSLAPKYSELSNVLFAIQNIVKDGKATALRTISRQKLKESVGTQEGQVILISYLNS